MKIEIKNVKINNSFSEETICFTADIFVDGKKTGYARNDGRGGCTHYSSYHKPNNDHDLRQAEAYAKTLPSTSHEFMGKTMVLESNLESLIDEMVYAIDNKREADKFQKKIQKACLNNIVWGVENGTSIKSMGWKSHTIEQLLKTQNGVTAIKNTIIRIKGEMKEGEKILNNNIPIVLYLDYSKNA
jgi:hypothetical protein